MLKISCSLLSQVLLLAFLRGAASAQDSRNSKTARDEVTADKWRQDLRYFLEELPKRSAAFLRRRSNSRFIAQRSFR